MLGHFKKRFRRYYWWICVVFLFIWQWFGYFQLGPQLLKNDLLSGGFGSIVSNRADTVFVRDFYTTYRNIGDNNVYLSHHLASDEDFIRKKLGTKYIRFATPENYFWADKPQEKYKVVYATWFARAKILTLYDFFRAVQTEEIIVDGKSYYHLESTRYWCMFFWLKRFERLEAWHY